MTSTYLSYLTFERNYGRALAARDPETVQSNGDIAQETEYFQRNIGKISSGTELAQDQRLYEYALTAFGLSDQIDNKALVISVLDEGIFDPFVKSDGTERANNINNLAKEFWFADEFLLADQRTNFITNAIDSAATKYVLSFGENPPANMTDEIDYFRDTIESISSGKELVANQRLFSFVLQAYDLTEQENNDELIAKALDAGGYNPFAGRVKLDAPANSLVDSRFRTIAQAFAFNEVGDQNVRTANFVEGVSSQYTTERLQQEARELSRGRASNPPFPANYDRDITYVREKIAGISSAEELVNDERLYRFVLTAFDLESQIPSKALIKKVLEEGVESDDALANQLVDTKFKSLASSLGFAELGGKNVRNPNFVEDIIDRFKRVKVETDAGDDNIGVRLASYFDRKTTSITSWFQVLGDRALREVVFTAFDLPDEMQQTSPDKLVSIFEQRMNIEDLTDPEKRAKFVERFTLMYDIRNGAPGQVSNTLSLYGIDPTLDSSSGSSGVISIDASTLSAATLF